MGPKWSAGARASDSPVVDRWRAELLDQLLHVVFWLGVIVAIPGIAFAIIAGESAVVAVDIVALVAVGYVTFRPGVTFRVRAVVLLVVAYSLGVFFLSTIGVVGQIYLSSFPVFATLLLGMRGAVVALVINACTLVVVGPSGFADSRLAIPGLDGWDEWLVVTLNFLFINAVMAVSCGILLRRLEQLLNDEQDLSSSLAERNAALERGEQIRVAFLRATSHELRTPLAAIVGFAHTLRERRTTLSDDQQAQLLERMTVNADRLAALITDLLDVDRLSSGLVTANRVPANLAALVRHVVHDAEVHPRTVHLALDDLTVWIDAPKIERAIANLLANALRHSPPDGVVRIATFRHDEQAIIRVDDDGDGIAAGYEEAIFAPFVQGPDRHRDPKPGTGLGLALTRELVALHGGTVRATNRTPTGARFEISLPCGEPPLDAA